MILPYGGSFPFRGNIPPPPSKKMYASGDVFPLKKPDAPLSISLEDAIETRKTIRVHGKAPVTSDQLGEFLFRCARVKETFTYLDEELSNALAPEGEPATSWRSIPSFTNVRGCRKGSTTTIPLTIL